MTTLHASRSALLLLGAFALAVAGCKTNPTAGFSDVQRTVVDRSGHNVEWPRSMADTDKADAAVRVLLQTNLTVESALQIALLNNRSLRATLEELGISRAELIQAGLPRNPQLSGHVRFPDRPPTAANIEAGIAEDFLDLLLLPLRKKVAELQYEQTKARVSHEILQLLAEVKEAFYTVQARQQFISRAEAILEVNEAVADLAERQHKAGNIADLELATQQTSFQEAKLEWARATVQLRSDRERLNRLLGLWGPGTGWKISADLPPIPAQEIPVTGLETRAIQQRLDLAAARHQVAQVLRAYNLRAGTRYLPTSINLGVDAERDPDRQWVIGPSFEFDLPLFDQGQGALARLAAQYRQAEWRLEALATDIRSEVRQIRDTLIAARDTAAFYEQIYLPQRTRIVNEMQLQYNAMNHGPFDLLNAKERQLTAEREYIEAWRDYWIGHALLEKALGGRLDSRPSESNADDASLKQADKQRQDNHRH
jgi:cobalt-zinc-cadmium efflux system outer membrane protein